MTKTTKIEKLENRQNLLIEKLEKKLTEKEIGMLAEIIDLEYKLTLISEGHNPDYWKSF